MIAKRLPILICIDALLVNMALLLVLWLRFDGDIPRQYMDSYLSLAVCFTLVWLSSFYAFGLYKRLWKYASLGELKSIVYAVSMGLLLNISIAYFWAEGGSLPLPRSFFVLAWMAVVIIIGGSRLWWRLFRDTHLHNGRARAGKPVLIVGAGDAGAAVTRELLNHDADHRVPVGFVDDDSTKHKLEMFGLPVLGGREDIPALVNRYGIQEIIIAIPSAPGRMIREIISVCQETTAFLKILPGMYELINGEISVNQIREVQVEDILGRETVKVDIESIAGYLTGRTVLITGAGGSIGSELCHQVAGFKPHLLILLGHGENSIFHIHREIGNAFSDLNLIPVIADIKDREAISNVFEYHRPDVVFHAAAHKHVPLMEYNPAEAVKNNVLGTYCVAKAADEYGVKNFVMISTDKAVNPSSIMGATKRAAEMAVQWVGKKSSTRFAAVRFGNVLASRGSVVPLFKEQIARGGPVTVTHPAVTRYFMTIPEAVQLIIQAGALAGDREVFVLDMGDPVKILDLAKNMIRLSGFKPGEDIEIVFTGLRPGEKLYEELLTDSEEVNVTKHKKIFTARVDKPDEHKLRGLLDAVQDTGRMLNRQEVIGLLRSVVPEFTGKEVVEVDSAAVSEVAATREDVSRDSVQAVAAH